MSEDIVDQEAVDPQDWDLEERDQWLEDGRLYDDSKEPEVEVLVEADE